MGPPPGLGTGYGWAPPPPRRRRWPLVVAGVSVLVLLVGLGVGGWAYGTGRLGFGPLSKADKAAATAIGDAVDSPSWADDEQRTCAATRLVHEHRSGDLAERGLIERDGDDWVFTGDWDTAEARVYADGVLACSDDWKKQLAEEWSLDETGCLDDVGRSHVADVLVDTAIQVDGDDAESVHDTAAARLDDCYGGAPDAVRATARPGDRSVDFDFTVPTAANATTTLSVDGPDGTETVTGTHYSAGTDEGGQQVCIDVTLTAHYGWGSTAASTPTHACGKAQPKRLWWTRLPSCTYSAGCTTWGLHVSGYATGIETLRLTSPVGHCPLTGGCTKTVVIGSDGRGSDDGLVLKVSGGGSLRTDDIDAHLGGLTARLHW